MSCPNSKVLVLTSKKLMDAGSFPACFTGIIQRVRRLNYVQTYFQFIVLGLFFWYCNDESLSAFGTFKDDPVSCLMASALTDCDYHDFVAHRLITQPTLFTDGAFHIVAFQTVCLIDLLDQQHTIASVSIRTGKRLFRR